MSYLTIARARAASPFSGQPGLAEIRLRKSAASSASTEYDIFLSHSRLDADLIAGIKTILEQGGRRVYVDWIEDPQLDRSRVTVETAEVLRLRMQHSASLIFTTSDNSPRSKWMPWELGYFDGSTPGHIGILPLVENEGDDFIGQEYLGLYPKIENLPLPSALRGLGIRTTAGNAPVEDLIRSRITLRA